MQHSKMTFTRSWAAGRQNSHQPGVNIEGSTFWINNSKPEKHLDCINDRNMKKWTIDLFDGSRDMLMASSEFWRMPKRIWASLGTCFPTLSTTATTFCHDKIKLQISFFEKARLCQVSTVFLSFLFRCGTPSWVLTSIMNVAFFFQVHQANTCFFSFHFSTLIFNLLLSLK